MYATLVYLAEHGAYIEAYSPYRTYQRLLNPTKNANYKVLEFLVIKHGININLQGVSGETILMEAVRLGNLETVDFLLGLGADASIRDNKGKTALDYAKECGFPDIARLLKNE